METKTLVICPVFNEQDAIEKFYFNLRENYSGDVLFVDDGSIDKSVDFLNRISLKNTFLIKHPKRRGYGAALISGINFSREKNYKKIITIDADLQHNPEHITRFLVELEEFDVVLGSRYAKKGVIADVPPDRFHINRHIAGLFELLFGVKFTDPFCGFRGYRNSFLDKICLKEHSYGFALEILLEIIRTGTFFMEIPVELIYLDSTRRFLDGLDDPKKRLNYYLEIIYSKKREMENEKKVFSCESSS